MILRLARFTAANILGNAEYTVRTRTRRLLCRLGFHSMHDYHSDSLTVRMCRYCPYESDY